jgi:hypothetical protein
LSIAQALRLLNNPSFCHQARVLRSEIAAVMASTTEQDQRDRFLLERVPPFVGRWGVLPPQAVDLLNPDARRPLVEAIGSGRWGVVPIFAWTRNQDIKTAVRKIRRIIHTQHQDAENGRRAQLDGWLESCGFSRTEIARAVWGRRQGLRRPSRAQAIGRLAEGDEQALLRQYLGQGLSPTQAEQRVYKRVRGSEPKATAAVRMAGQRYVSTLRDLNAALARPTISEPVSHALTMLIGADADDVDAAEIRHRVAAVKKALTDPQSP